MVTGGAGFIGSNVVKLLDSKGYDIIVYDNLSTGYEKNLAPYPHVQLIKGDVRDKDKLCEAGRKCEIIFHLAASVGNIKSLKNPREDSEINVTGTLNVLECASKNKIKKVIYSSSAALFGEPQYSPIDEKHPSEPDSPYGVSKMAGEKHVLCFGQIYDISVVSLRYFNVYGTNQRYDAYGNVIPIFATLLLDSKSITVYGDGNQTRDFVDVEDVAVANVLTAEKKGLSGKFNIGSGKSITINELVDMFKHVFPAAKVNYSPPRRGEVIHSLAKIDLAKQNFGYNPTKINTKKIEKYIIWLKSETAKK